MWALIEKGEVIEVITQPRTIVAGSGDNAVKYGKGTVFDVWSDGDRKAIGIFPINISNKVNTKLYKSQSFDDLVFDVGDDSVDATYPLVAKDTLANLKTDLISNMRENIKSQYRYLVDDDYAEKYRVESDGGSHEISDTVKAYASNLKTNFASYKDAVNGATDISSLGSISMVWPDTPK